MFVFSILIPVATASHRAAVQLVAKASHRAAVQLIVKASHRAAICACACIYLSIYPSMDLSRYRFIYELLSLSVRLSIYLSTDPLACKHTATSVSFVLDVSRFNSTLSSPRPSWSASVGHCRHLSRTGLTTATAITPTTKNNCRHTTCNSPTFQKYLPRKRPADTQLATARLFQISTSDVNCAVRAAGALFERSTTKSCCITVTLKHFWSQARRKFAFNYFYRKIF